MEILPTADNDVTSYTYARLKRELFRLANRNLRFKKGQSDYLKFTYEEGERVEPLSTLYPLLSDEYSFSALRNRTPYSAMNQPETKLRPSVEFEFSLLNRMAGMPMLAHIAMQAYGLSLEDSVIEAGPSSIEHQLQFRIDTDVAMLAMHEGVRHLDEEGAVVSQVCSCGLDHDMTALHEPIDLPGVMDEDDDIQNRFRPLDELYHQFVVPVAPQQALDDWKITRALESQAGQSTAPKLVLAFAVLENIHRVLEEQTGVEA
ncbi:MAG: hypothetical protein ACHQTE_00270 [Candidatus Saccharimonadales bacterium]